jgi:methylenetetrahydrofolate dehydrogenase (NADP+)/methenyltetrahydrofolate cyclohydrolase
MSAVLLDGKRAGNRLLEAVERSRGDFEREHGRAPGLAVILVGADPASAIYVKRKEEKARAIGFVSRSHPLPADVSAETLRALIAALNEDDAIDGILVQLPLPPHLDEHRILATIAPAKDVDGFHVINAGLLMRGLPALAPCTPRGCMILLSEARPKLSGLNAVVIGRSNIVGKPMAHLLLQSDCTVTIAHSRTQSLPDLVNRADIVVAGVGRAGFVRGSWLKPGATVIDVGINRSDLGIVGDVCFDEALKVAGHITPVPGGVGPMTIACLLDNTLAAARLRVSARRIGQCDG